MSYLILKNMKKVICSIAFLTLVTTISSCTADELPSNNPTENQIATSAKEGDIDPPLKTPPPPPTTNP
jgi:hypothetical protein